MQTITLTLIALICGLYDNKYHKIPNFLAFSGIAYGLLCCEQKSWTITIITLIVLFFVGILGVAGMGDIKLWMMTVCIVGLRGLVIIILISEILFIMDQFRINRDQAETTIKAMFFDVFSHKRFIIYKQNKYPYGMYFFMGCVLYNLFTVLCSV